MYLFRISPKACLLSLFVGLILFPMGAFALTPIARYDVVPNQRIAYNETFGFGVVAFSKAGIASVKFTISGQGYSGGVKTATAMTHNERTGVYEYWVPISANEFASNGPFTVTALVTGRDGDTRSLEALQLNVDATNTLPQIKAWVSSSGSDSSGKINEESQPFATIAQAVKEIQAANSGKADGGVIYLQEGSYVGSYNSNNAPQTTNEWLTITKAPNAIQANVIIAAGRSELDTHLLRLKEVTLQNSGGFSIPNGIADYIWFDKCRMIGRGRNLDGSNPVQNRQGRGYWTNNYMHDMDMAIAQGILSRGNDISKLSNDAHQNTYCVINDRIDDIDPEPQYPNSYPHADAYQMHVENMPSPDNIIVYGIFATNLHYQGFFARPSSNGSPVKSASNVALVNNFFEARAPLRTPGGGVSSLQGKWDHLLLWHNTFTGRELAIYKDTATGAFDFRNVSLIGNYFHGFREVITNGVIFDAGNSNNNEAISNHYYLSYDDGFGADNRTHSPDTATPASASAGTLELDLSDTSHYVHFGYPLNESSVLTNRVSEVKVAADCVNVPRGSVADVGAFEEISGQVASSPPSAPVLSVE